MPASRMRGALDRGQLNERPGPTRRLQIWIGGQLELAPSQAAKVALFLAAINNARNAVVWKLGA